MARAWRVTRRRPYGAADIALLLEVVGAARGERPSSSTETWTMAPATVKVVALVFDKASPPGDMAWAPSASFACCIAVSLALASSLAFASAASCTLDSSNAPC